MLFQSPLFALFFVALVGLLLIFRERTARHVLLLMSSYLFYAAWDARFLALLGISTTVDYWVGARLHRSDDPSARKRWVTLSLLVNLGILGFFKYFGFFTDSAADLAALFDVELQRSTLAIVLPVGISFYTFQSLSYTIDIYRREIEPEASPLRFALFVGFFPQLVAGPIVRAKQFLPQLRDDAPPRAKDLAPGLSLFAVGLFKKVVIADHLARVVDPVFDTPEFFGTGALALGAVAMAIQLYCDFSGYSDMAIGVARIMGYRLPENFDQPFASLSPREMWRRWHISLSSWLRDYVYFSLGGNRRGKLRTWWNLMATMTVGGLWHGAAWTFVGWGFGHGVLLVLDRVWKRSHAAGLRGWLVTNLAWVGLLICFRSASLSDFGLYLSRLFRLSDGVESIDPALAAWAIALIALAGAGQLRAAARFDRWADGRPPALKTLIAGGLIVLAYALSAGENRAFIYFQF